jgi:cold shock CspA family protein
MRYQGRITEWKDDRGFGFITPNGGGERVFVHISAFGKGQRRPVGNEIVTYEIVNDPRKGNRAAAVRYREVRPVPTRRQTIGFANRLVSVILVAGIGYYAWQHFNLKTGLHESFRDGASAAQRDSAPEFECEGKTRCSQMHSCREATFYLENCPGVAMDGDNDGIPCEDQWCGR